MKIIIVLLNLICFIKINCGTGMEGKILIINFKCFLIMFVIFCHYVGSLNLKNKEDT